MTDKPHWKHDCDKCKLLGHTIGGGRMADLYVCDQGGLGTTLIARYGNDGPAYYSCPPAYAHAEGHAELFAAKALWEESLNIPESANGLLGTS